MITNRDSVCNYEFLYLFSANYENFCYLHRKNPLKWHFGGVRRWQRRLKIKHDLNRDNAYGSKKYGYQFSAKYDNFKYTLGKNLLKRRFGGFMTAATAFHYLKQSKNKDTIGIKNLITNHQPYLTIFLVFQWKIC